MAPLNPALSTPTITNFRDVAKSINAHTPSSSNQQNQNQPTLNPGLFYRSALPSTASPSALTNLTETYHIKTILDLRTDTEIAEQEQEHQQPNPNQASPISKTRISLNGPSYSLALIKQLPYLSLLKLAALYPFPSQRTRAISILGSEVMTARGLSGLAIDTLSHSTAEIAQVIKFLADCTNYPVLVHCTQGKDRTGLVVLLVCLLCGVQLQLEGKEGGSGVLEADYMQSEVELAPEREARVREIAKIGLPASFAGCEEGWTGVVGGWLEREWGGVEGYLEGGCGVTRETVKRVRGVLVARKGGE